MGTAFSDDPVPAVMSGSTSCGNGLSRAMDVMGHLQTYAVQRTSAPACTIVPYNHHYDRFADPARGIEDAAAGFHRGARKRGGITVRGKA
jgi:hypothetical protein